MPFLITFTHRHADYQNREPWDRSDSDSRIAIGTRETAAAAVAYLAALDVNASGSARRREVAVHTLNLPGYCGVVTFPDGNRERGGVWTILALDAFARGGYEAPGTVYTTHDAATIRHRIYGDSYAAGVITGVYGHPTHPAGKRATMARSVRRETAGRGNWLAVAVPKPSPYPAA